MLSVKLYFAMTVFAAKLFVPVVQSFAHVFHFTEGLERT